MGTAYLVHGQEVLINNKSYQIERHINNEIQLIEANSFRTTQMPHERFLGKFANGEVNFPSTKTRYIPEHIANKKGERVSAFLEFYPEELVQDMKIKRTFLEAYLKRYGDVRSQKIIAIGINELWNKNWSAPPHPASVARWLKRYIEAGRDIRALCPSHFLKGNRSQRYDDSVIQSCQSAIKRIYLKPERGSLQLTLTEATRLVAQENQLRTDDSQLTWPTKSLLSSLIHALPVHDIFAARYGKSAAEHKFRNSVNSVETSRPLERVEVDHTELDLILVDAKSGITIDRPWLTLIIDHYTKCILGFSVSYDKPSHMTVARALKMALLPKVDIQQRWSSIKGDWLMFGLMQNLIVDNAFEFHGMSLEDACYMMGITISYCPRKKGWWKATVERTIGTLNRSVTDGLPGRTFSSVKERANYKAEKKATIPLEVFEEMIAKWIVDIYHETVHDTLGKKPSTVWKEGIQLADIPMVTNFNELDAVLGVIDKRTLSHKGIEINNLFYNSPQLGMVRGKFGDLKDIKVKWDPEDLGHIYVLPPDGSTLRVPVTPQYEDYAVGLPNYKHKFIKKFAKEHLDEKNNPLSLHVAKEALLDFGQQAVQDVKKNKRRFAYALRKQHIVKSSPAKTQTSKALPLEMPSYDMHNIPTFEVKKSKRKIKEDAVYG